MQPAGVRKDEWLTFGIEEDAGGIEALGAFIFSLHEQSDLFDGRVSFIGSKSPNFSVTPIAVNVTAIEV